MYALGNCSLLRTDYVQDQIEVHTFTPNRGYYVYYPSNLFRNACSFENVQFQKISVVPHGRDWNFLGGSVRPKNFKKCAELDWNFQKGGGGGSYNPFHGRGMDIFWN